MGNTTPPVVDQANGIIRLARRPRRKNFLAARRDCGLVVLLLILAMASVTQWAEDLWDRHLDAAPGEGGSGGRRTHRLLVIDGSLSMGLKVGDTTCFEKARALAAKIVQDSTRGDGFSIVLMASAPKRLVGGAAGPAEDRGKIAAALENLRLPHGNSDLARTFVTVLDLLRQSPAKFVDREVYFLTDLQKTSWILPRPKDVAKTLTEIQERAHTIVLDVGAEKPPPNLAVTRSIPRRGETLDSRHGSRLFSGLAAWRIALVM